MAELPCGRSACADQIGLFSVLPCHWLSGGQLPPGIPAAFSGLGLPIRVYSRECAPVRGWDLLLTFGV
jgi:hypothetical protein